MITFLCFFCVLFDEGGRIQISLLAGHRRSASETFICTNIKLWLGSFVIYQGDLDQYCSKKIFQGVSGPPVPPLDPHMTCQLSGNFRKSQMWNGNLLGVNCTWNTSVTNTCCLFH